MVSFKKGGGLGHRDGHAQGKIHVMTQEEGGDVKDDWHGAFTSQ